MIVKRLQWLWTRARSDGELDEELEFHIDMERERLERCGVAPAEARRRAPVVFGGYDRIAEEPRDARGFAWLENTWRRSFWCARSG